jgi:hypothetical protein
MLNLTNEESRHYGYLEEYLSLTSHFLKYSFDTVSCSYYHQNINLSTFDETTASHYDLSQSNHNSFVWDVYHLTPIFSGNSFTSNILFDPQQFGLSTDLSTQLNIFTIEKPLEQDVIKFYSPVQETMLFEVTGVNHSYLVEDSLHLYNINVRKLNINYEQFESNYIINQNFYYMQELNKYIDYNKYLAFQNKENLENYINQYYIPNEVKYDLDDNNNQALLYIIEKSLYTKLKIIDKTKIQETQIDKNNLVNKIKELYELYE